MKNGTAKTYAEMIVNFKDAAAERNVEVTQAHVDALNMAYGDFVINKLAAAIRVPDRRCTDCQLETKKVIHGLAQVLRPV